MQDLAFRKKKGKFSGSPGEAAERFKTAGTIKTTISYNAPAEKVQEME